MSSAVRNGFMRPKKTPPGSKYDVPAVVFYARPLKSPAMQMIADAAAAKCELVHTEAGMSGALDRGAWPGRRRFLNDAGIHTPHNLPVVPICRRFFRLHRRANHHDTLAHPAPMKRDVSADRHEPWGGDAMAADAARDERGGGGRRSRVVLIPRRWDQVSRAIPRSDGGYRARTPGRARISRKPIAQGVPVVPAALLSLACAECTAFCTQGSRVRPASGIPCALFAEGVERT